VLLLVAPLYVVNALLPPIVAELHHTSEMRRMEHVLQTVAGLASLPCVVIFVVLVVAGKMLLALLFGSFYLDAYPLLIVLCAGQLANIATGSWQIVLPMTGHKRQSLLLSVLNLVLQLVTGCVGGYYFGVMGVAAASCLTIVVVNIAGMLVVHRYFKIWTFVSIRRDILRDVINIIRKNLRRRRTLSEIPAE